MVDVQLFQPERISDNKDQTSPNPMVNWGPEEKSWAQNPTCRQVGNQIICDNIYGDDKPAVTRASFSLQGGNNAFRAIVDLQASMGLLPSTQIARVSDTQAPPYFPPGTLPKPSYTNFSFDQYGFNQGSNPTKDRVLPGTVPGTRPLDPFSFNQGDKTPITPVAPINSDIIPPYIKPNGHDVPLPPIPGPVGPPKPIDVPAPPTPKPIDVPAPPAPQPQPDVNPYNQPDQPQPYQPCQPCPGRGGGRWFPGMIAGRVIGRIFGGRCR